MRRATLAAATTVAATAVMLPATAQAVAPFGAAHRVLPGSCAGSMTVLNSTGARHGFTTCRLSSGLIDLDAVSATPGATTWKHVRVAAKVGYLMAVADDGHSSYALIDSASGVDLVTRTRSGSTHLSKLAANNRSYPVSGNGALVARSGKWLAVWSASTQLTGATGCDYLFQARTLGGTQSAHNTSLCATEPSLALASSGEPVLAYRGSIEAAGGAIMVSSAHAGGWSKPHVLTPKNQVGKVPTVSVAGTTTHVAWLQLVPKQNHYLAHVATQVGHGAWHAKSFSEAAAFDTAVVSHPQTATSKGRLFVAWTVVGAGNKERVHIEEYAGGKWTQRDVGDGTTGDAVLTELAAVNGRAYLVMEHSDQTVYDLAARQ